MLQLFADKQTKIKDMQRFAIPSLSYQTHILQQM